MSDTEVDFRAAIVYRVWWIAQKCLARASDMPRNYFKLVKRWKEPFRKAARADIPALAQAWAAKMASTGDQCRSPYKEVGLSASFVRR